MAPVVMDTRGIYDAITRNLSPLHGLREARAGYELTLAVNQGIQSGVQFRWVNGLAQLADAMTKASNRKILLHLFGQKQHWRLVHDEKFESGRRVHKKELEKRFEGYAGQLRGLRERACGEEELSMDQ